MTKSELKDKITSFDFDIAARTSELAAEIREGKITKEDAEGKIAEMRAKKAEMEKELASMDAPLAGNAKTSLRNKDFIDAVAEKRSITIGNNGAINQVKEIVKAVKEKDEILNRARFFYGANAATNIPVLDPRPATPSGQAEGASSISADSTAAMTTCEITPKAYVSILPVTLEALKMNSVDIENELPSIFEDAFRKAMHAGLITGTGTSKEMKGLFVSAAANTAGQTTLANAQTALKISDVRDLALKAVALDEEFEIIMNPSVYSKLLADSTSGEDVKLAKEELIRSKTIEGVKVTLDGNAPSTFATGNIVAVAAPLSRYAIGVASEVIIDPIKVKGDTNTYFQAAMFFSGKQITDSDVLSLKCGTITG